jgi:hypothetical protein
MKKTTRLRQSGNLVAAAVLIIVALAGFGLSVIRTVSSTSASSTLALEGYQTLYLAGSALEYGSLQVKNNIDTNNPTVYCDGAWKTTQTFYDGEFRFKCTQYVPSITTTATITASSMVVPISSATNVAPLGRVQIGSEQLDYSAVSTDATICGTAPCLVVKQRGSNNTSAAAHATGSAATQAQLVIEAVGAIPTIASPFAIKTVQKAIAVTKLSYTNSWAVGEDGAVFRKVNSQWQSYALSPSTTNTLNSVTCLSSSYCWMVGDNTTMYQWNGTTWSSYTGATFSGGSTISLKKMTCVSTSDCWLITSNNDAYHWDGANWSLSSHFSFTLRGISCSGSNFCLVVGTNGNVYKWDGASWAAMSSGTTQDLNAVSCPNNALCYAVGEGGVIRKMSGTTWSSQASPTNKDLLSVSCGDTANCWAFGTNRDRNANYAGGVWQNKTVAISNKQINDVYCFSFNQCFLAVDRLDAFDALIGIWNGSTWGNDLVQAGAAKNLMSVTTDSTLTTTLQFENIAWRQVFN